MKIKKILSGIVAGALALSTMASMSLFSTSAAEEVVWEGEAVASWSKEVVLDGASNIITAVEGGILGFEGTVTGKNPQIQFVTKQGSDWTWTPFADAEGNEYFDINATTGKLSIKLSAEQASQLTTSKEFDIKGQGYTLTKLTYTAPGGSSGGSTSEPETVWEGEAAASWSKEVVLDGASNIITAVEGGILGFEGTVTGKNPQIQFVTKQGSDWTWTPFTDAEGNEYFDINATTGKLSIKLSAEQASQLTTSKEFDIKGQGYTLTKLTYTAPVGTSGGSSSTVESSTVDTSSEVESSTVDPTSEALKTWVSDASTKKSAWYSKCASDKYVMAPADLAFDPSLVDGLKFTIRYDGDNANGSFGVSTVGEGWGQVEWSLDTTDVLPEECTQVSANVYSFEFTNIVADWFEGNAIDPEASEASWGLNGFNRLGEANDWVETTFELLSIDLLDGDGNVVYSAGGTSDSSSEVESSLPDSSSEVESSLPDSSSEAESSLPDSSSEVESSLPDSSSEAEIGTGDIIDLNIVKYQTKDEGKTVRFIYIANESAVEAANSGNVQLLVSATIDDDPVETNTAVTTAYRSIYAGGQLITAPEGKVFIISPEVSGLSAELGSGVVAKFTLDSIPQRYARVYEP